MSWTEIENSHLLKGGCTQCGTDTLAAPGQTETALCGPCRLDRAHEITRGGHVQQFSAPSGVVPEAFRKKSWKRGDDGVIRDRWGRYVLPDPVTGELREYTRVSTLKDVFSNSWNIRMWDRRTAVYGTAKNPDLAAAAAQAVPDTDGRFEPNNPWRDHLDRVAKLAFVAGGGESGANNGTDWHRWREMFDATSDWSNLDVPEEVTKTLQARQAEMERHGLTVPAGMSERVVIIPELDAAGTFDELFQAADGTLFIGDEKSQRAFYDGGLLEAIQLAAYSRAKWIVDVAKVGNDPAANLRALTPMPAVDQTTAKIIWVPIGKGYAEVKDVDLTEAWGWAQLAVRLREARKCEWVTTAPVPHLDVMRDQASRAVAAMEAAGLDGSDVVSSGQAEEIEAVVREALAETAGCVCTVETDRETGAVTRIVDLESACRNGNAMHQAERERRKANRPVPDMADVHEPAWEDQPERDARRNSDGTTSQAILDQISEFILAAPDRPALERLWKDTGDLWNEDLVNMAQTRAAVLEKLPHSELAVCTSERHAWNCPGPHAAGVRTIREILVQRIEGLRGAPDAETELNAMWGVQNPLGHWDDELTALGMAVLGRG